MRDAAVLILRFALGVIFIAHGLQDAFGMFGGYGLLGSKEILMKLGFAPALVWAILGVSVELAGGVCLLTGLATRLFSFLLFLITLIATIKVNLMYGFFNTSGGYEYNLLILSVCLALMLLGAGKYKIGNKIK